MLISFHLTSSRSSSLSSLTIPHHKKSQVVGRFLPPGPGVGAPSGVTPSSHGKMRYRQYLALRVETLGVLPAACVSAIETQDVSNSGSSKFGCFVGDTSNPNNKSLSRSVVVTWYFVSPYSLRGGLNLTTFSWISTCATLIVAGHNPLLAVISAAHVACGENES